MLEPRHIVRLQLNGARVAAHEAMPKPYHVTKALTGHFAVLSDAVISELLNIAPEEFKRQLRTSRERGVEFIGCDSARNQIGVSAATSLIKSGSVLSKHIIVPNDFMKFDRKLKDHIVIGAFIRGTVTDGKLEPWSDTVEVAGWTTAKDIEWMQQSTPPPAFQSKLQITTFPCSALQPIETLFKHIDTTTIAL